MDFILIHLGKWAQKCDVQSNARKVAVSYFQVQDKMARYSKYRKQQKGLLKDVGGQFPVGFCTFPNAKRVYLFPGEEDNGE